MHELSIAQAVVEIVSKHANGRRVQRVEMRIGHLRQVVPSALEFGFELLTADTPLQGAQLVIEDVAVQVHCQACGADTTLVEFPFACGECGKWDVRVVAGEELLVDAIEVDEETTTEGTAHGGATDGIRR
ncbi:MAG: hydrogenase maturation nickel metallochaperone HypA [Solirubrobacteraceae bacterium]